MEDRSFNGWRDTIHHGVVQQFDIPKIPVFEKTDLPIYPAESFGYSLAYPTNVVYNARFTGTVP